MYNEPSEMEMNIAGMLMDGFPEAETAETLRQPPVVVSNIRGEIHQDECWRTPRVKLLRGEVS